MHFHSPHFLSIHNGLLTLQQLMVWAPGIKKEYDLGFIVRVMIQKEGQR